MFKLRRSRKGQDWGVGSCFSLPLKDGTFCIGQVLSIEPEALNSVVCAFYRTKIAAPAMPAQLPNDDLLSVLFVTRDLLDSGDWRVLGQMSPISVSPYLDLSAARNSGFVGVKVIGSGIVQTLVNAVHQLAPWNSYKDPQYLDRLLISPELKPTQPLLREDGKNRGG